jgi:hypothetical protein
MCTYKCCALKAYMTSLVPLEIGTEENISGAHNVEHHNGGRWFTKM